jgi:hypothetical protein
MKIGYRASLQWMVDHDDTSWLDDADPIPSVTAVFAADIFDKDIEKLVADMRKLREKSAA